MQTYCLKNNISYNTKEQIKNIKQSLKSAIPVLREGLETVQFYLDKDDSQQAMQLFDTAIQLMQKTSSSMQMLMLLDISFTDKLKDTHIKLQETSQEIIKALEARDYILLGDLLTYELTLILDKWYEAVID